MPTGYTAAIADGITFKEYALTCARAFGALVSMRDEPHDAPIPKELKPSDYHKKEALKARNELEALKNMSLAECSRKAKAEYSQLLKAHKEYIANKESLKRKYLDMLGQVLRFEPPSDAHIEFCKFMIDQIKRSIDFDCDTSFSVKPTVRTGKEWKSENIYRLEKNLAYHEKEYTEECARVAERNLWIKQLRDGLEEHLNPKPEDGK